MRCTFCGSVLEQEGRGHDCPAAPGRTDDGPAGWRMATWALIGATGAFGLTALAGLATLALLFVTGGEGPVVVAVLRGLAAVDGLSLVLLIAHVVMYVVWTRMSRRLVERRGGDGRHETRHWAMTVWSACFVAAFLLPVLFGGVFGDAPDIQTVLLLAVLRLVLRLVAAGALIVGVVLVSRGVRRILATNAPTTANDLDGAVLRFDPPGRL